MMFFGKTAKADEDVKTQPAPIRKEVKERLLWLAHLEDLAKSASPDVEAEADAYEARFADEYAEQVQAWSFDCKRYGDFLTLFATWATGPSGPVKESVSLNIGAVKAIELGSGRAPARVARVTFRTSCHNIVGEWCGSVSFSGIGESAPPPGYKYNVTPNFPQSPRRGLVIDRASARNNHSVVSGFVGYVQNPQHAVQNFPAPAIDDAVHFDGINKSLLVPAGLGQGVHDKILAEIQRGYEWSELPS